MNIKHLLDTLTYIHSLCEFDDFTFLKRRVILHPVKTAEFWFYANCDLPTRVRKKHHVPRIIRAVNFSESWEVVRPCANEKYRTGNTIRLTGSDRWFTIKWKTKWHPNCWKFYITSYLLPCFNDAIWPPAIIICEKPSQNVSVWPRTLAL